MAHRVYVSELAYEKLEGRPLKPGDGKLNDRNFNCNNYINDNTELLINNTEVRIILSVVKHKI
jgi:hypothetical protein